MYLTQNIFNWKFIVVTSHDSELTFHLFVRFLRLKYNVYTFEDIQICSWIKRPRSKTPSWPEYGPGPQKAILLCVILRRKRRVERDLKYQFGIFSQNTF